MKSILDKASGFAKKHFALTLGVLAILIVIIIVVITIVSGGGETSDKWGKGITKGVPMPSGLNAASVKVSETHAAAYFEDVSSEEVSEYVTLIEEECDVVFENERFPRSAVCDDKIIVIHYNVTEKKLSVTVAAKGDNQAISTGDQQ